MQQAISYRDRDGFVIVTDHSVKRYVQISYAQTYDHLMSSGLYQRLVDEGLLIAHKEAAPDTAVQNFYKILEPEMISFISMPYEWSASQWKELVLNFLKINCICIEYGMILKDATPFNFTFHKGHCIFFDTLSFEMYREGDSWIAYRQFCETLLGPLSLIFFNDVAWARMMEAYINGWQLSFISANLPLRTWFKSPTLLHIHWHAKFSQQTSQKINGSSLSKEKLLILWQMIDKGVQKWSPSKNKKIWLTYYDTDILSDQYLQSKISIVSGWMDDIKPAKVIDLGSNTGRFSIIASAHAKKVIAVEPDHDCIEKLRLDIRKRGITNIETVIADITQPSPAIGWKNEERFSLLQRLNCDMLFALALLHHVCISANIPLAFVAELFAQLTGRYALVEFIPRSDPKVAALLLNRKDIFQDYAEDHFIQCFSTWFNLVKVASCDASDRKLYLWERK